MKGPAIVQSSPPSLLELLQEQFSRSTTQQIVGDGNPVLDWGLWGRALYDPLEGFLSQPGKEFRARLVETAYQLAGGRGPCPEPLVPLIEILHAGSLIVDDIEDDSVVRRGRAALHREFGVPVALNAGNWLYFWAFALVERIGLGPHVELSLYRWLSSTLLRCHYGQALDLTARLTALDQEQVYDVVATSTRLKTGCLLELACAFGAIAAGAPRETVQALTRFGSELGVGLQMLDDHGGLANEARRHKGYEDLIHARPTWPWAWLARDLEPLRFDELQALAQSVERKHLAPERLAHSLYDELGERGRKRIRRQLRSALQRLKLHVKNPSVLAAFSAELHRLERSYG